MMKIVVTCPLMVNQIDEFREIGKANGFELFAPNVLQRFSEDELRRLVPEFDGWIIGDDPATRAVLEAGIKGKLKAVVKWGVGIDNVDLDAVKEFNLPFANTPGMFGREVADVAVAYVVMLARHLHTINEEVKKNRWPKPLGISLSGKNLALVGFGDIGRNVTKRLIAFGMNMFIYDPYKKPLEEFPTIKHVIWPERLDEMDFIVFACSLTEETRQMFDSSAIERCKHGIRVVNVARGRLIDESALYAGVMSGRVHSVALDVYEQEPLPTDSILKSCPQIIFGSHNCANTDEAVHRASCRAIDLLFKFLHSY